MYIWKFVIWFAFTKFMYTREEERDKEKRLGGKEKEKRPNENGHLKEKYYLYFIILLI